MSLLRLGALLALLAALSGCGASASSESKPAIVAGVDGEVLTRHDLAPWLQAARSRQAHTTPGGPSALQSAMVSLVRAAWVETEAARRRLKITPHEVDAAIAKERRSFPNERLYRNYQRASSGSAAQNRKTIVLNLLLEKLRARAFPPREPSEAELREFYRGRKRAFLEPHGRAIRAVLAKERNTALAARRALERGMPWKQARQRFGEAGGRLGTRMRMDTTNVLTSLRRSVFAAPHRVLTGPLDVEGTWWLFEVLKDFPKRQHSFADVRPELLPIWHAQWRENTLYRETKIIERHFKPSTVCVAEFAAPACGAVVDSAAELEERSR